MNFFKSNSKFWKKFGEFQGLKKLRAVAVATIQLRYNGWVTELNNNNDDVNTPTGLDNLLYSSDKWINCIVQFLELCYFIQ